MKTANSSDSDAPTLSNFSLGGAIARLFQQCYRSKDPPSLETKLEKRELLAMAIPLRKRFVSSVGYGFQ